MNKFNFFSKKIIISLLIISTPSLIRAGLWDGFDRLYNFLKENSNVVITAVVGLSCCGLLLWKKNIEIKKLKKDHKEELTYECQGAALRAQQDCKGTLSKLIECGVNNMRQKETNHKICLIHNLEAEIKSLKEKAKKSSTQLPHHATSADNKYSAEVKLEINVYPERDIPKLQAIRKSSLKQRTSTMPSAMPRNVIGVTFAD